MSEIDPDDLMSISDMRQWAAQELKDAAKAAELRSKQVNALIDEYVSGKLTPVEATARYRQYQRRWGEALPGATANNGLSDESILARMDETQRTVRAVLNPSQKPERFR